MALPFLPGLKKILPSKESGTGGFSISDIAGGIKGLSKNVLDFFRGIEITKPEPRAGETFGLPQLKEPIIKLPGRAGEIQKKVTGFLRPETEEEQAIDVALSVMPIAKISKTAGRILRKKGAQLTQKTKDKILREVKDIVVKKEIPLKERIPPKITPSAAEKVIAKKSPGEDISEAITWLDNEIKTAAKPAKAELKVIQKAERARRTGALAGIFERGEGKAGFVKALGKLKGALATTEQKRFKIGEVVEEQVNKLFRAAQLNPELTVYEKLGTQSALTKVLSGTIPTTSELELLKRTYGNKLVNTILAQRTLGEKVWGGVLQAINVPRSIMTSVDLSAPFRQGLYLTSHPREFFGSFKGMFKSFGSERAFKAVVDSIEAMPEYPLMKSGKLALTDLGTSLTKREEAFMSSWAEKIPLVGRVVRASGRAYVGFLNKLRADVFAKLIKGARAAGKDVAPESDLTKEIAKFVNVMSGRGLLGRFERAAPALNGIFFSPRLAASRLTILNPIYYIKADPFVRKEALKSLFTVLGAGSVMLGIAKAGGAEVGIDPRSSDFGKIKIGNTRIDIWGGTQQYVRMAGQMITGKYVSSTTGKEITLGEGYKPLTRYGIALRQLETKTSPVASFLIALMKQQDFKGEPINVPKEIGQRFVPMVLGDMYDLAKDNPSLLPVELLAVFGFGLQTYKQRLKPSGELPGIEKTKGGLPGLGGKSLPGLPGL